MLIARMLHPIPLQRAEVVRVTQLGAQVFEDPPVSIAALQTELACKMRAEIVLHAIVVEQRVVAVEQEYDVIGHFHAAASVAAGP